MRPLLAATGTVRQTWKLHAHLHRKRMPPARAFKWDRLRELRDRLPTLDVVRERFPIRWPLQGGNGKEEQPVEPVQQKPEPAKLSVSEAVKQGTLGLGFSAGGLLFPYYIGVTETLTELGIITKDTPLGGASAGSLVVVCHHAGLEPARVTEACLKLAADCRKSGTRGRLGTVLEKVLVEILPEDSHERVKGKAFVAVTKAFPVAKSELISEFESKEDLISALMTSCHIPWWFDNSLVTTFRGSLYYDGGLTNFIPLPPGIDVGVRVCCLPARQLKTVYPIDITPDRFESWPYTASEMLAWAFEPAEPEILHQLIAKGRKDAEAWALQSGAVDGAEGQGRAEQAKQQMQEEEYPALKS